MASDRGRTPYSNARALTRSRAHLRARRRPHLDLITLCDDGRSDLRADEGTNAALNNLFIATHTRM